MPSTNEAQTIGELGQAYLQGVAWMTSAVEAAKSAGQLPSEKDPTLEEEWAAWLRVSQSAFNGGQTSGGVADELTYAVKRLKEYAARLEAITGKVTGIAGLVDAATARIEPSLWDRALKLATIALGIYAGLTILRVFYGGGK